jgi:hypothetical protein
MAPRNVLLEKAGKLARMSWDEMGVRLRQGVTKRSDALVWGVGAGSVARETRAMSRDGNHPRSAPPLKGHAASTPHFFFEPNDIGQIISVLQERLPQQAQEIEERAERICGHRFDLLGYKGLDFGNPIDWHFDPVNGKHSPRKPWYKIRFLDFNLAGDHKIIWELNRHQHLVTLAKAYRLTNQERFVTELLDQWRHWREQNPYPAGINWASSLEVAFRTLSWIWMSHILAGSSVVPETFHFDLARALALNSRHIERYLSTYWSPNTHLLGEAVALFFVGVLYPGLRSASRWRELGWRIVLEQAKRQVGPDGMHFEGSLYYHVYALDFFLHARILAAASLIPVPKELDEILVRMLELLCGLSQAGPMPRFGDDDGGRVFDPGRNRGRRLLDPLSTGAVLFDRGDFKAASGGLTEETVWLLGAEGAARFDVLPSSISPVVSRSFPAGGLYVMASGGPAGAPPLQLVVRAGWPRPGNCGHSHADTLSVHVSAGGEEWTTDPGTFRYISAGRERDYFRGASAHSTLVVDRESPAEPAGPFAWRSLPEVQVERWITGESIDLFQGSHNGYHRPPSPVTHRRWVIHCKQKFWLVRDLAEGSGEHQLDIFWHFATDLTPSYTPPGFTLAPPSNSGPRGNFTGMVILPAEGHGWSQEAQRGRVSPAYGAEETAAVIHFAKQSSLPDEFVAVLEPLTEESRQAGRLTSIISSSGDYTARGFRYLRPDGLYLFVFAGEGRDWQLGSWKSDARFIYCSAGEGTRNLSIALCGGSYLEISSQRLVACREPFERYELHFANGSATASSSSAGVPVNCKSDELIAALRNEPLVLRG